MILRAKHHFIIHPFFKLYTLWKIKRDFSQRELIHDFRSEKKAVLLLSNHVSWWDGFWAMYVNLKVLRRKFHFMMLEEHLRKHWFFNYTGGFSVSKNSRSLVETIQYTRSLLDNPENMVLIFPQGSIQSQHQHDITFQKGIERILEGKSDEVKLVFMVNLCDFFSQPKPGIWIYLKEYQSNVNKLEDIQSAYQLFFNSCLLAQKGRSEV